MVFKDYYKILELAPGATIADIKKSFRRLALLYHPDRNYGSRLHEAKFKEIKEAYEVLSDSRQRQEYNSQRRTQPQPEKKKPTFRQPTAQSIMAEVVEFRKKTDSADPERLNKYTLYYQIQHLLAIQNIIIIKHAHDPRLNRQFINEILHCSRFLLFPEVEKICKHLLELAGTDNESYQRIYQFSRRSRIQTYWNKYKLILAIIVAIIFCLLIYLISTNF